MRLAGVKANASVDALNQLAGNDNKWPCQVHRRMHRRVGSASAESSFPSPAPHNTGRPVDPGVETPLPALGASASITPSHSAAGTPGPGASRNACEDCLGGDVKGLNDVLLAAMASKASQLQPNKSITPVGSPAEAPSTMSTSQ